jgi:lipopolysaccharide/colanic/teichoic acid biosynthesis glycosyltransferase
MRNEPGRNPGGQTDGIRPPDNWWIRWGKQAFDVAVTACSAPLWGPVLVLELLLTWLSSGRPALFRQVRIGLHSEPFVILKVRTMRTDGGAAPSGLFGEWTVRDDPRITPLGRCLRRWRLDEIPQMICVLRGDMSLIGPRPEMPDVAARLASSLPGYAARHLVKPGLTGLCQVSASYHAFDSMDGLRARLADDLAYVEHLSAALDFKILLRTVGVLARGAGVS